MGGRLCNVMFKNALTVLVTLVVILALLEFSLFLAGLRFKARIDLQDPHLGPDVKRVVCIGESTTFGVKIRQEKAYPVVLERRLRELDGHDVKVYNLGVPGITSTTILRNLEKNLLMFEPDLVILNIGANDFSWSLSQQSSIRDPSLPMTWTKFLYQFRTFRLYKMLTDLKKNSNFARESGDQTTLIAIYDRSRDEVALKNKAFRRSAAAQLDFNTRQMISLARRYEVEILFVGYMTSMATPYMLKTVRSEGVPWTDMTMNKSVAPYTTSDYFHPNERGHWNIAKRIAATIEEHGLLD